MHHQREVEAVQVCLPLERDEGMSAHPDRVPGSVLTEQWCGPLCPALCRHGRLRRPVPIVTGDNSTTGAVKALPPGGPVGPALTAPR